MRYWLFTLLTLLATPLAADLISVSAKVEPQVARRGETVTLKLEFTVDKGYHAYHKDNPGYSTPLKVEFTELSGLVQVGETLWPKYHEHVDESDPTWIEYELSGTFELVYTWRVPAKAADVLRIAGRYDAQVCDAKGCQERSGTFKIEFNVEAAAAPEPTPEGQGGDLKKELAETRKALEDKVNGLSDELAALKRELAEARKASEELSKTLKDYIKSQHEKAAASGAKDEHGYYEDYDFALAEAKKQGKLLLIDFNGEY